MTPFTFEWSRQDDAVILKLSGQFFLSDTSEFDSQVDQILKERPARVIVEMSGLSAIGSAALGSLLKLQMRAKQQACDVSLTALQPGVEGVIRSAKLDNILRIA